MAELMILRSRLREAGSSQVRRLLPAAYLFEGSAVNWMTAGRGIADSERAPKERDGVTEWIPLPGSPSFFS